MGRSQSVIVVRDDLGVLEIFANQFESKAETAHKICGLAQKWQIGDWMGPPTLQYQERGLGQPTLRFQGNVDGATHSPVPRKCGWPLDYGWPLLDSVAARRSRHRHPFSCARRRSTTPSATGPPCTRCGSSPATADIRTTELYFVRKEEDAEVAARKIEIRPMKNKGECNPEDEPAVEESKAGLGHRIRMGWTQRQGIDWS